MTFITILLLVTLVWLAIRLRKERLSKNLPAVFRKRTRDAAHKQQIIESEIQPQFTSNGTGSAVQNAHAVMSSKLEHYMRLCNSSIDNFDNSDDLATKFYEITLLEKNLKELLKIAPENRTARQVEQMIPEMRRKIEAKLVESHKILQPTIATIARHGQETDDFIAEIDWEGQFQQVEQAWLSGDYDLARVWLQKFAYAITGNDSVPQEVKDRFKRVMTEFAKEDPLYRDIVEHVMPMVAAQPGLLQSAIYKHYPQYDQEQMRYVLYFAHEIGDIPRRKKGRSYELFPPGRIIDVESSTRRAQ